MNDWNDWNWLLRWMSDVPDVTEQKWQLARDIAYFLERAFQRRHFSLPICLFENEMKVIRHQAETKHLHPMTFLTFSLEMSKGSVRIPETWKLPPLLMFWMALSFNGLNGAKRLNCLNDLNGLRL